MRCISLKDEDEETATKQTRPPRRVRGQLENKCRVVSQVDQAKGRGKGHVVVDDWQIDAGLGERAPQ